MQLAPKNLQTPKWDWMIPVAMLTAPTAAFIGSVSFAVFSVETWTTKRNADLVKVGVNVLRVDPEKEKQISAARAWALDLIDANAGGVKVSPEAREQLLKGPLVYGFYPDAITSFYPDVVTRYSPDALDKPARHHPSPEAPK